MNYVDMHMHVLNNVDDGSTSQDESLDMISKAYESGVRTIFATPHGGVFKNLLKRHHIKKKFTILKKLSEEKFPDFKIYLGAEIRIYPDEIEQIIKKLKNKKLPSLGGTKYVLLEFNNFGICFEEIVSIMHRVMEAGFVPILAHAERLYKVIPGLSELQRLHDMGCYFQINTDYLIDKSNPEAHLRVQAILTKKLADFVGSDAHGMDRRCPKYDDEIVYLKENFDKKYIDYILTNRLVADEAKKEET